MKWSLYRAWKHAIVPALVLGALIVIRKSPEGSFAWSAGTVLALVLGFLYVAEEIVWIWRGNGRPCRSCGGEVRMKSFRMRNTCPYCGNQL